MTWPSFSMKLIQFYPIQALVWLMTRLVIRTLSFVHDFNLANPQRQKIDWESMEKVQEQAKVAELRGYTGKPLYSVWHGSESEQRAVFVDEVKCVGCLKCALFAEKTFAVESVYGRARVVAQWADPEHKIVEAIEACPVDCIS